MNLDEDHENKGNLAHVHGNDSNYANICTIQLQVTNTPYAIFILCPASNGSHPQT